MLTILAVLVAIGVLLLALILVALWSIESTLEASPMRLSEIKVGVEAACKLLRDLPYEIDQSSEEKTEY
jgi:hypothetical protein